MMEEREGRSVMIVKCLSDGRSGQSNSVFSSLFVGLKKSEKSVGRGLPMKQPILEHKHSITSL